MPTVQSFNTSNPGNASSITVTKPSGLAVGDLMIFNYAYADATDTANTISGWTHEVSNYGGTQKTGLQWKIADSSDVAASNFTMSFTGTVGTPLAGLLRIDGYYSLDLLNDNKDTGVNGDHTLAMSVTPATANNLLLFFLMNNENNSISNYAIANDNPTWTEKYDIQSGSNVCLALAVADRTQSTATGDASFSVSAPSGSEDCYGIMVAIGSITNATVNGEHGIISINGFSGSYNTTANITGNHGVLLVNGNNGAGTVGVPDWTNTNKSADPSWINLPKT